MSGEPRQALFQMYIGFRNAGLFCGETHETGGIAVAFCFEGSAVAALPEADKSRHAPTAIGLLMGSEAVDDGALLLRFEQIRNFRGSPQEKGLIVEGAFFVSAEEKFAEIAELRLDFGLPRILAGSGADSNSGERGAEVGRVVRFQ